MPNGTYKSNNLKAAVRTPHKSLCSPIGLHHLGFGDTKRLGLVQNLLLYSLVGFSQHHLRQPLCSVLVSCFGTFIFEFSASCISPLTSTRLVPTVPYQSLYQNHASYTPDTTCSVTECLASSSWSYFTPPALMSS